MIYVWEVATKLPNRKDLQALALFEPPRDNLESDPLDVLHLDNRLYISNYYSGREEMRKEQFCGSQKDILFSS